MSAVLQEPVTARGVSAKPHPLDPLSHDEIAAARTIVWTAKNLGDSHRVPMIRLEEPPKRELGDPALHRKAFVVILDRSNGETAEAIVDLTARTLVSWTQIPVHVPPYGQPPVMIEEFMRCEEIVKADPGWRAAVKRRGLTDADIALAQVDPFSSGFFDYEFERGRRVLRAVSFKKSDPKDNAYAHPIEGVVAVVDLIAERVVDLLDEPDGRASARTRPSL